MLRLILLLFLYLGISSASSLTSMKRISGLSEIIANYDAFIIDQWGVLHDGKTLYDGSLEAMAYLRACDKKCIMLSNSSKRRMNSVNGLKKVGLDPELYFDEIITSGEMAFQEIKNRTHPFLNHKSNKDKLNVFCFGNNQDDEEYISTANCNYATPEDADFILARGTFAFNDAKIFDDADILMSEIDPWLLRCATRQLPMLVSNPDFLRPGALCPMPGQISRRYREILQLMYPDAPDMARSLVYSYGKPYDAVYEACFSLLSGINKSRVVGIGDSIDHDVAGANRNGISSLFIENGIHAPRLSSIEGSATRASMDKLDAFFAEEIAKDDIFCPDVSIPSLCK